MVSLTKQKPKIGKKGAIHKIAKKLTKLRKRPISIQVREVVREHFERTQKKFEK